MRKTFLAAAAVFTALSVMTNGLFFLRVSADEIESGRCGEDLVWNFSEGTLTISGTGDMTDYSGSPDDKAPWWGKDMTIKNVVIDYGVTSIGDFAFDDPAWYSTLESVKIPDSVKRIGIRAFKDCNKLEEIIIPESVTVIDEEAFQYCSGLKSITIPDSVEYVGAFAFFFCRSLKEINIPDNIDTIRRRTFAECKNIRSADIPDGVKSIEEGAFRYCYKLISITIPDSVKTIDKEAFYFCKSIDLGSIIVPDGVEYIGDSAFSECKHTVIYYPSTASLGKDCFHRTKAAVRYTIENGKAKITDIIGDTSDIVFPDKISGYDVVYEDVSSGAGIYEIYEII